MAETIRFLLIEHPKTGEQYAVLPEVFHRDFEPQGFEQRGYEGGVPYEAPKRATKGATKPDEKAE
jgi:hypothetical protein